MHNLATNRSRCVLTLLVSADESWDFLAMKLRIGLKPSEKYPKN